MTLAKKGARLITVDGVRYRWVVAPNDEPGMAIVVERAEYPAQRMVTWVDHGAVITPRLVARVIQRALDQGWTPGSGQHRSCSASATARRSLSVVFSPC